jgi:uncharacterized protein (TIGR01244 family)
MKTSTAVVSLALLAAVGAAAQLPKTVDPAFIPNYVVVKPGLASAGRPTEDGLKELKARGFRTVIDLSAPSEDGVAEEKAALERLGLRYVHVPVTATTFSAADVDAVQAVLDDADAGPTLLHCASANRVGAVWAVIQARGGKPIDEAIAEGKRVGLRSASMIEAAKKVAGTAARP